MKALIVSILVFLASVCTAFAEDTVSVNEAVDDTCGCIENGNNGDNGNHYGNDNNPKERGYQKDKCKKTDSSEIASDSTILDDSSAVPSDLGTAIESRSAGLNKAAITCSPNPFTVSGAVNFRITGSTKVCLKIYDMSGRLVKTLFSGIRSTGSYQAVWQGTNEQGFNVPSGRYVLRMQTGSASFVHTVLLSR